MIPRLVAFSLVALAMGASGSPAQGQAPQGTWKGTYVCAQGRTGITLTIAPVDTGALRGFMEFYATPDNPKVPSGRYTLDGTLNAASDRIRLQPDYWLQQPPGYVMVGFDGTLDGDRFSGQVFGHPACTTFSVVRQTPPT